MTAFIIKSGLCMILLYGLYWMFLRKEKLFIFNRYFLIIAVLFSFAVPFISIPLYMVDLHQSKEIISVFNRIDKTSHSDLEIRALPEEVQPSWNSVSRSINLPGIPEKQSIGFSQIILSVYFAGFALMLFRFCRNILIVKRLFRNSEKIENEWYRIALLRAEIVPFSFLRTVYLNIDDYFGERITPNVLRHELEHVRQFHSGDVIFFEIVHIIFWFNPVLLLYKNAARINHEYLADEAVISTMPEIRTYALDLINFVSRRVGVPFTSGFSPSMIRLRLLMLNTSTTRRAKNIRMLVSIAASVLLMTVFSFRPEYDDQQNRRNKKQITGNEDIVIEEVFFRGSDFSRLKAQVVFDGRLLVSGDTLSVDPNQIKYMEVLKGRKAKRKYGKESRDGVILISTYDDTKRKMADSMLYRQIFTVNNEIPEGTINIPVTNLYSFNIWTYPVFPNQATEKPWRTIGIMTRDFYKIRGKVVEENGEPLPGVYVTATDHPSGVTTDSEGRFLLEDVRPGSMAQLSADGYDPLFFRVSGALHTLDMKITLEKEGTSEYKQIDMSVSYVILDFSGSWRVNWEQSKTIWPGKTRDMLKYDIHQYDGDSLTLAYTRIDEKNIEHAEIGSIVFNTVKTIVRNDLKHRISCRISSDGQSFSVTHEIASILGLSGDYKSAEKFSLSPDGNKLFIREFRYPDNNSQDGKEVEMLVFDKI